MWTQVSACSLLQIDRLCYHYWIVEQICRLIHYESQHVEQQNSESGSFYSDLWMQEMQDDFLFGLMLPVTQRFLFSFCIWPFILLWTKAHYPNVWLCAQWNPTLTAKFHIPNELVFTIWKHNPETKPRVCLELASDCSKNSHTSILRTPPQTDLW